MRTKIRNTVSVDAAHWGEILCAAKYSSENIALFAGHALEELRKLPSESVDVCLTSPPYWGLRDYESDDQIGHEASLEEYVENLTVIFAEVHRVLKPSGCAWLNLGDTYLNGVGTINGRPPEKGWRRNKQLALVPFRVAISLQEDGWWVRNNLVWHKPNAMPSSVKDRLTNTWESIFLLTKSERYYFDLDSVRVPHVTDDTVEKRRLEEGKNNGKAKEKSEMRKWLNSPRHRASIDGLKDIERRPFAPDPVVLAAYLRENAKKANLSIKEIAEIIEQPFERTRHYFRTDRIGSRLPPDETWQKLKILLSLDAQYDEAMSIEVGDNAFRNHPLGRNPGDVLKYSVSRGDEQHFAVMPLELASWMLASTLPSGGVCIDPFMGSGTTGIAALRHGGKFVGVDVNVSYIEYFHEKLSGGRLLV